jgi:succinoglycan biosynthesis protein ExoA
VAVWIGGLVIKAAFEWTRKGSGDDQSSEKVAECDGESGRGGESAVGPRVLIVIPTLDEGDHIQAVLNDLLADLPSVAQVRVVVADGGSTDATIPLVELVAARHPMVELLRSPAGIQSSAVNLAARRFGRDAEVLIRCDAHSLYPPGFCQRLLDTLRRTEADAVVVPMDSIGHTCLQRAVAWVSNSAVGTGGSAHRGRRVSGPVDHGHHAAFRMDSFRRAGGYNETFTHNEDAEFDCRQRALGGKVYLDGENRVGYQPRSTFVALWRQYFSYGVGRSRTARRHPSSLRLRQLAAPAHVALCIAALALFPWTARLLLWPALYASLLAATSVGLAVRHRSPCGLLAGPAAGVMHAAWGSGFLLGLIGRRERLWRPSMSVPLWADSAPADRA